MCQDLPPAVRSQIFSGDYRLGANPGHVTVDSTFLHLHGNDVRLIFVAKDDPFLFG